MSHLLAALLSLLAFLRVLRGHPLDNELSSLATNNACVSAILSSLPQLCINSTSLDHLRVAINITNCVTSKETEDIYAEDFPGSIGLNSLKSAALLLPHVTTICLSYQTSYSTLSANARDDLYNRDLVLTSYFCQITLAYLQSAICNTRDMTFHVIVFAITWMMIPWTQLSSKRFQAILCQSLLLVWERSNSFNHASPFSLIPRICLIVWLIASLVWFYTSFKSSKSLSLFDCPSCEKKVDDSIKLLLNK